jgi:hypothetical protein
MEQLAGASPTYPLIEAAIKRSRLPRVWTITIFASALLLLLILMAAIDGVLTTLLKWSELRYVLWFIFFTAYILVVYPFMMRSREQAVLAFKPLLYLEDDAFNKVAANISKPSRRWEWTAVFLGIAFFVGGFIQPWTLDWVSGYFWLTVYFVFTVTIVYGLMSWLIYDTLIGIVRVSRLGRRDLKLDILDTEMLAPVARWSLGISLVFVGVISLSIIVMWEIILDWRTITGFVIAICVTLLIFFLSMWSAHRVMSEAKKRKLTLVRDHLAEISHELEDRVAKGQRRGMTELSSTITALATYKREVQEAPTWPFNAGIIRRLLLSIVTPGIVYLIKILSQVGIRFGS